MKKLNISFLFLFLMGSGAVSAQTTAVWDSTYRPAVYKIKIDQFKTYSSSPKDIVFLGNSITAGTDWQELLESRKVKNRGISGDITYGILERLSDITDTKPAKIFLLIGINDISRNIPDEKIISNYKKIVSRIRAESPRTKIYVQTLLPVNESFKKFPNHYGKDDHILRINDMIRSLADNRNIFVIDLYSKFLDSENRLRSELTHDGLHLTAQGYQVWAEILKSGKYLR